MRDILNTTRDRIVASLKAGACTAEGLRKSPQLTFTDLPWIGIALEELLFERSIARDENEHYFLTHNFPQHEAQ